MHRRHGSVDVPDPRGFVDFLCENAQQYPVWWEFLQTDEGKLTKHIEETGNVPAGVKLIQKTEIEGSNVTHVRIVHGPAVSVVTLRASALRVPTAADRPTARVLST
jgi:hypothetical protein